MNAPAMFNMSANPASLKAPTAGAHYRSAALGDPAREVLSEARLRHTS